MARLPRFFVPDFPLHVVQRGNNRGTIFGAPDDFWLFHKCLTQFAKRHAVDVHAYVLMSNHVHLLATPASPESMPQMMKSLGRKYVAHFNRKYARTGTLWEGRYRAAIVDSDQYLLACMRYIELNPVRAGLVQRPEQYRWSSYGCNAVGTADALVTPHPLFQRLGGSDSQRRIAYRALFIGALPDEQLHRIRDATQNAWALGGTGFQRRVSALTRRAYRLAPGPSAKGPR